MFSSINNRTKYILSKLGYFAYSETLQHTNLNQPLLYTRRRGAILTLHSNSMDFYSENEIDLLSKIELSVLSKDEDIKLDNFLLSNKDLASNSIHQLQTAKLIINFTDIEFDLQKNSIKAPSLKLLFDNPVMKKKLWQEMKIILDESN
tara:strand:+ start:29163 stop:29606 length:444 start_codon:yes stop_codon:yes gene_type:complete